MLNYSSFCRNGFCTNADKVIKSTIEKKEITVFVLHVAGVGADRSVDVDDEVEPDDGGRRRQQLPLEAAQPRLDVGHHFESVSALKKITLHHFFTDVFVSSFHFKDAII